MRRIANIALLLLVTIIGFSSCGGNSLQQFRNAYSALQQDNSIQYTQTLSISSGNENYHYSYEYIYSDEDCLMIMDAGLDTEMIILFHDNEAFYTYKNQHQWIQTNSPLPLSYPWKEGNLQELSDWDYTSHYKNNTLFLTFTNSDDSSIDYVIQNGRIIKITYKSLTSIEQSDPEANVFQVTEYILHDISDEEADSILQPYLTDLLT